MIMNILDYVNKNKELINDKINTLDAMVFSRLAYIHFEELLDKLPLKIKELPKYIENIKINSHDKKLINYLKDNPRFNDLEIIRCKNILDKEKEEQFCAITIQLPNNYRFIAFRGTNKNIIGYKEDMNMSFMEIPSQIDAKKYVDEEKTLDYLYLGGHSKGGNLSMYAGVNTSIMKKRQIKRIYNFDGPGFLKIDNKFIKMKKKMVNYFPESCIVGRLMYNDNYINPVVTNKLGIEAHNLYNWKINNNDLEYGILKKCSDEFHEACIDAIENISVERKKLIINYLFNLIINGNIKNIKELTMDDVKKILNNTPKITKEEKSYLMNLMKKMLRCSIE